MEGLLSTVITPLVFKYKLYFPQFLTVPALLLSAFLGAATTILGKRAGCVGGNKRGGKPMLAGSRGNMLEGQNAKNMMNLWDLVRGSVQTKGCDISNKEQFTLTMIYKTMCATKYETRCTDSYK